MDFLKQLQAGIGQAYMPSYGSLDPAAQQAASNQGMMQLGAGMLANSRARPMEAFGQSLQGLQRQGIQNMQGQMLADQMAENKDERERRKRINDARSKFLSVPQIAQSMGDGWPDLVKDAPELAWQVFTDASQGKGTGAIQNWRHYQQLKQSDPAAAKEFAQTFLGRQNLDSAHGAAILYEDDEGQTGVGYATKSGGFMPVQTPGKILGPYDKSFQTSQGKAAGEAGAQVPGAIVQAEQTIKEIDKLIDDPNLSGVSGIESYLPDAGVAAVSGPAALGVRRRIEQLRGKAFLEAYNMLRGGGQITEAEGAKAEAALARLDTAQSDQDYITALKDFKDAVMVGVQKLQAQANAGQRQQPSQQTPSANGGIVDWQTYFGGQ